MRHTHKQEIDGIEWTVTEFSATEGLKLLTGLTKLCGGPVARAFEAATSNGLDSVVDFGLLGSAASELAARLDEDEVIGLVKRLLASTLANGEEAGGRRFDIVFQGKYLTLFKVIGFVLEANYRIPLGDLVAAASGGALGQG